MDRDGICSIPDTSRVTPCLTYHRDDIQLFLRNIAPQEFTQKQIFRQIRHFMSLLYSHPYAERECKS